MESIRMWQRLARQLKKKDLQLAPIIKKVGLPSFQFHSDPFRALVESILSQQLAPSAADSIIRKFSQLAPPFPRPAGVLKLSDASLRSAGVSSQKLGYLRALSEQWQKTAWRRGWGQLEDAALVERLVQVKGVGVWTAHMFLIFCLGRPDILPVDDYGLRRGVHKLYALKAIPKPKEVPALVLHWKGAASVGSWYIWQGLNRGVI